MRRLTWATALLAVLAACSDPSTVVVLDAPEGVEQGDVDRATEIIAQRLDAGEVADYRIDIEDSAIRIGVPEDTPPIVLEMAVANGVISLRPVWGIFEESPMIVDPEGRHPDGVDESTGLTVHDRTSSESYLSDGNLVYHLGPAFVISSEMPSAIAGTVPSQLISHPDWWVVKPAFTESGGAAFLHATKVAATYPRGDPRRQIAIVVDGVVLSAPAMAPEVNSTDGIDPEEMLITIGVEDQDALIAQVLATYLIAGPLPFPLEANRSPDSDA